MCNSEENSLGGDINILLIVPPVISIRDLRESDNPHLRWGDVISMPIGAMSIASYTSKYAKANFKILDLNVEISKHKDRFVSMEWEDFLRGCLLEMDKFPDIVGISAIFNSNADYLHPISAIAKEIWSKTLVVAGGGLPTNLYSDVLGFAPAIDAVVIGEGEKPFCGLVLASNRREYLETASGWMTREKNCFRSSCYYGFSIRS